MFRPLMLSTSGMRITKNKYIEMPQKLCEKIRMTFCYLIFYMCLGSHKICNLSMHLFSVTDRPEDYNMSGWNM
jgi:hypothetical protein